MATEPNRDGQGQGQHPPPHQQSPYYPPDPYRGQYPPPQQWAGPPPGGYTYPDPQAPHQYPHYPPPPQGHEMHQPPPPQHPDPFAPRLPPPQMMYPYPPPDPYRAAPQMAASYSQPAPRQRTAIACRYCRRRKIRCSGYEGENGKCSNCVRFGQDCLFTPVSSSAQAFVPAHVAFPQLRNQGNNGQGGRPPQLYGAHGQPLPPEYGSGQPNPADQQKYPPPGQPYYPQYPPTSAPYDDRVAAGQGNDPRSAERRDSGNAAYNYPDPTNIAPVSPATSASSYQTGPPQGYYPSAPPSATAPRRASPQSNHSFDARVTDSPQGAASTLSATGREQPIPGRTPPPVSGANTPAGRPGMSVAGMLGGPSGGSPGANGASRSTHDNDMLNALNRRNRGSDDERK